MIIHITRGADVVYRQVNDESKQLNTVVAHLMQQPSGTSMRTVITNNGHEMTFNTADIALEPIVRKFNGILIRETKAKTN